MPRTSGSTGRPLALLKSDGNVDEACEGRTRAALVRRAPMGARRHPSRSADLPRAGGEVRDGAGPTLVRDGVRALQTNGPLWQLRMNCLSYCAHVHMHHGAEDALLFPGLRRVEPGLGPVIEARGRSSDRIRHPRPHRGGSERPRRARRRDAHRTCWLASSTSRAGELSPPPEGGSSDVPM
jgi:hypothetical protein